MVWEYKEKNHTDHFSYYVCDWFSSFFFSHKAFLFCYLIFTIHTFLLEQSKSVVQTNKNQLLLNDWMNIFSLDEYYVRQIR